MLFRGSSGYRSEQARGHQGMGMKGDNPATVMQVVCEVCGYSVHLYMDPSQSPAVGVSETRRAMTGKLVDDGQWL